MEIYDLAPDSPARLANLSTRGYVGSGDSVLIGGMVIAGDGHSGTTPIMVRGRGRSMAEYVPDRIADPKVQLYSNTIQMLEVDDWAGSWTANRFRDGGTHESYRPQNPFEAVFHHNLSPGAYTVILSGSQGSVGNGIIELYINQ